VIVHDRPALFQALTAPAPQTIRLLLPMKNTLAGYFSKSGNCSAYAIVETSSLPKILDQ
jgi:hypothetical protein